MAVLANVLVVGLVILAIAFVGIKVILPIYRKTIREAAEKDRVEEHLRKHAEAEMREQERHRQAAETEMDEILEVKDER